MLDGEWWWATHQQVRRWYVATTQMQGHVRAGYCHRDRVLGRPDLRVVQEWFPVKDVENEWLTANEQTPQSASKGLLITHPGQY